uniref:T4 RNA ligase 1-like N-terminal domain-containing protein n=1 Tax=viral metagenome TaxID=1070528 RepID=A0A6C0KQ75_9ZZZZ
MEPVVTFNELPRFEGQIRICETAGDLSLYHYKTVDENSDPLLKQIRGIVFDNLGNLVMRGFPYTPEYTHDMPNLQAKIGDLSQYKITLSFEGTILRVFYYNDRWHVSTHRRLSAESSYWALRSVSFEELFRQGIDTILQQSESPLKTYMQQRGINEFNYDTFFNSLHKTRQYMFLISPVGENRIVSATYGDVPLVLHVGTFIEQKFTIDDYIGLPIPNQLKFGSVEELTTFVAGIHPLQAQGVLLMSPNGFFKISSKMYSFLHELRGNQANLQLRYLELFNEPDRLNTFVQLYPEFNHHFAHVNEKISSLVKTIHNAYISRFINKQLTFLPQAQFFFLMKVHNNYCNTNIKTTSARVRQLLMDEPAINIYRMINV